MTHNEQVVEILDDGDDDDDDDRAKGLTANDNNESRPGASRVLALCVGAREQAGKLVHELTGSRLATKPLELVGSSSCSCFHLDPSAGSGAKNSTDLRLCEVSPRAI